MEFDDGNDDKSAMEWFYLCIASVPLVLSDILYAFLNAIPYALIRNVVSSTQFGISVGFVYSGSIVGEFIVSLIFNLKTVAANNSLDITSSLNENTVSVAENVLFTPIIYIICACLMGFISTKLLVFKHQSTEFDDVFDDDQVMNHPLNKSNFQSESENYDIN